MSSNNHGRKSNRNSRRNRAIAVDISLRRRKVAELLQTTGMTSPEIASLLGVDESTIRYDITALKNEAVDFLYDLCKQDLCFFYRQTILDLDHTRHECWNIYHSTNKKITPKDKLQALRTIGQLDLVRFELLKNGELVMSVKSLNERINAIKLAQNPSQGSGQQEPQQQRRTPTV
jgi:predicted transcriptional regulator